MTELQLRAISGVAMIAVAIGALWLGGVAFWALASLLAVLMMVEWGQMARAPRWQITLGAAMVAIMMAYGGLLFDPALMAAHLSSLLIQAVELTGLAAILLAVITFRARLGAGVLYAVLPALALVYLRQSPDGFGITLFTLVMVWATDIGAYFAGRMIGGPKLAPAISPNKTWAGLIGGMTAAQLIGLLLMGSLDVPLWLGTMGWLVAIVAQAGDLFESWLKRRSGVKDSGKLLPGHGGVLDRLDGVVPVAVVVAASLSYLVVSVGHP